MSTYRVTFEVEPIFADTPLEDVRGWAESWADLNFDGTLSSAVVINVEELD